MAFSDWLKRNFGKGSQLDQDLTDFDQNVFGGLFGSIRNGVGSLKNSVQGILKQVGDYLPSYLDSLTGAHMTGAEREAMAHQDMREDTQYQRTVSDMQAAGLNPMMLAGGASVNQAGSTQSNVGASMSLGDIMQLALLPEQKALLRAQAKNQTASAVERSTRSKWNTSRVDEVKQNIKESQARIDKLAAEENKLWSDADLNAVKALELYSNIDLNEVTAANMEALQPSVIALNEAKTTEAKAKASLDFWNMMYQKGLINAGMCEKVAAKVAAETRLADKQGNLLDEQTTKTAIENSIKQGRWSDTISTEGTFWDKFVMHLDRTTSIVGNVLSISK